MKILYVGPFTTPQFRCRLGISSFTGIGAENKVRSILKILVQDGHEVVLLSSASLSGGRRIWQSAEREYPQSDTGGATIIYPWTVLISPIGGLLKCVRSARLIRGLFEEFVPDVAIVYNSYLFESLAARELARLRGTPIVLQIEDLPLARRRGWLNIKPVLDQYCWNGMLERASAFTAVNQSILEALPAEKPRALLPGVIDPLLAEYRELRSAPFTGGRRLLGYFGGLDPRKGVAVLLDLVPRLAHPWQLVVTGAGPLAPAFARLSREHPERLRFLGQVPRPQLYREMCGCDCVVLPLEQITRGGQGVFPFKVFEYLVSGAHVIACPLPGRINLDLSFIQRWDGHAETLLAMLSQAEEAFTRETPHRDEAVTSILANYSYAAIAGLFRRLFEQISSAR